MTLRRNRLMILITDRCKTLKAPSLSHVKLLFLLFTSGWYLWADLAFALTFNHLNLCSKSNCNLFLEHNLFNNCLEEVTVTVHYRSLTVNLWGIYPVQVPKNMGTGPGFLLNIPLFNLISGPGYNDEFLIFS